MDTTVLQKVVGEMLDLPEFVGIASVGVHTRGNFGSTPLHVAAGRGDLAGITALLDAGADIQSRGEDGFSPLHDAVEQGHLEAVKLLLNRGADPFALNDDEESPVQVARSLDEDEIEELLMKFAERLSG